VPFAAIRNSAYPRLVRRLCEPDASKVLAFVSELTRLDELLAFPPRVLASLHRLIESDAVAYSELDPVHQSSILQIHYRADGESETTRGDEGWESRDLWWRVRHTHPLCGYRAASADWTTARKVSDFATLGQFRRTPIYEAFYRGEIDYWLDVGLAPTPTRTRVFIFVRHTGSDFDEPTALC
jgi:hypothetical protein